ncbi:hypothetical protein HK099_005233 [Clydaea vesicula]|uniref:Uncharacterized protein n=1 Tax=Clydaea vesicula TaxID=447962 RepID=A0AAD5XZQ6_9FUNG|nr:hypothetical protein HK099_005233 [Clydaea vesicula]
MNEIKDKDIHQSSITQHDFYQESLYSNQPQQSYSNIQLYPQQPQQHFLQPIPDRVNSPNFAQQHQLQQIPAFPQRNNSPKLNGGQTFQQRRDQNPRRPSNSSNHSDTFSNVSLNPLHYRRPSSPSISQSPRRPSSPILSQTHRRPSIETRIPISNIFIHQPLPQHPSVPNQKQQFSQQSHSQSSTPPSFAPHNKIQGNIVNRHQNTNVAAVTKNNLHQFSSNLNQQPKLSLPPPPKSPPPQTFSNSKHNQPKTNLKFQDNIFKREPSPSPSAVSNSRRPSINSLIDYDEDFLDCVDDFLAIFDTVEVHDMKILKEYCRVLIARWAKRTARLYTVADSFAAAAVGARRFLMQTGNAMNEHTTKVEVMLATDLAFLAVESNHIKWTIANGVQDSMGNYINVPAYSKENQLISVERLKENYLHRAQIWSPAHATKANNALKKMKKRRSKFLSVFMDGNVVSNYKKVDHKNNQLTQNSSALKPNISNELREYNMEDNRLVNFRELNHHYSSQRSKILNTDKISSVKTYIHVPQHSLEDKIVSNDQFSPRSPKSPGRFKTVVERRVTPELGSPVRSNTERTSVRRPLGIYGQLADFKINSGGDSFNDDVEYMGPPVLHQINNLTIPVEENTGNGIISPGGSVTGMKGRRGSAEALLQSVLDECENLLDVLRE